MHLDTETCKSLVGKLSIDELNLVTGVDVERQRLREALNRLVQATSRNSDILPLEVKSALYDAKQLLMVTE